MVLIALGVWFLSAKKDEWLARGGAIVSEGEAAGRRLQDTECLDAAMARYGSNPGRLGALPVRAWLTGCLRTAQRTERFCADVPSSDAIAATVAWRLGTCRRYGFESDSACANVLAEVQRTCGQK